jgi:hypothetical protein
VIKKIFSIIKKDPILLVVGILVLAFASYIMFSTFGFENGEFRIKDKLYSDFLSHLPLIRSFSMGNNFPPEYPHFPGEPIRYHFLFYFIVGMLEKIGLRLDIALNIMSVIGFAGLMLVIFLLARKISKSNFVGIGAVLTIVFNTSLSWIYYFVIGNNRISNIVDILKQNVFTAFGPYNDTIISAFWNLNIYTNQRHLAFALLLLILAIWFTVYKKGHKYFWATILIIGLMAWFHKAILLMIFITLGVFFLIYKEKRKKIFLTVIFGILAAIPGLLFLSQNNLKDTSFLGFQPGFLYKGTTWWEMNINNDFGKWIIYWFLNMGILPLLAFCGFLITALNREVSKSQKIIKQIVQKIFNIETVWFIVASVVFIIANLFSFGSDIANNHKLINFTSMIWGIYAFIFLKEISKNLKIVGKYFIVPIMMVVLFFGGICDLFPIINDGKGSISEYYNTSNGRWVYENSKPGDVFLNLSSDYYFVLISGRKIFSGGPYINWSLGYPVNKRDSEIKEIIKNSFEKDSFCKYLRKNKIIYVYIKEDEKKFLEIEYEPQVFIDKYSDGIKLENGIRMYRTIEICN